MKKLIIIFGLLLATITAFGKPAYKQWGKKATVVDIKEYKADQYFTMPYIYVYKKGKKDGDMVLSVSVITNDIAKKSVHPMVMLTTSEPIDFSVGQNSVFLGSISTNREEVVDKAGSTALMLFSGGHITSDVKKTVTKVVTNKQRTLSFVSNGYEAGRYTYMAVFTNINPEALAYYQIFVEPTFKNPYMHSFNLYEVASVYRNIVWQEEKRQEALAKAEAERQANEKVQWVSNTTTPRFSLSATPVDKVQGILDGWKNNFSKKAETLDAIYGEIRYGSRINPEWLVKDGLGFVCIGRLYSPQSEIAIDLVLMHIGDKYIVAITPLQEYVNSGASIMIGGFRMNKPMDMPFGRAFVYEINPDDLSKIGSQWFITGIQGYSFVFIQNSSFERDLYNALKKAGAYK